MNDSEKFQQLSDLFYKKNFGRASKADIELQLNPKLLRIRAEYFIELCTLLEPEEKQKAIRNKLKERFKEADKEDSAFDERHIGKSLIEGAVNLTTIAANLVSEFSPENILEKELFRLLKSN